MYVLRRRRPVEVAQDPDRAVGPRPQTVHCVERRGLRLRSGRRQPSRPIAREDLDRAACGRRRKDLGGSTKVVTEQQPAVVERNQVIRPAQPNGKRVIADPVRNRGIRHTREWVGVEPCNTFANTGDRIHADDRVVIANQQVATGAHGNLGRIDRETNIFGRGRHARDREVPRRPRVSEVDDSGPQHDLTRRVHLRSVELGDHHGAHDGHGSRDHQSQEN